MPPRKAPIHAQEVELVGAVVAGDEQVRNRILGIANLALDHMENILVRGSSTNRDALVKTLLPALVRSMERKEEIDELADLKASQALLMEAMALAPHVAPMAPPVQDPME